MESLDDVIDAMIADRVINRHRNKWLIAIAVVVVAALVIFLAGGWKKKEGRKVDTFTAPYTIEAGRFEYGFQSAKIVRIKQNDKVVKEVHVDLEVRNIDTEEQKSASPGNQLLRLVPGDGGELVHSNGPTCGDETRARDKWDLNYKFVYGLPAAKCYTKFTVDPDFERLPDGTVEVGVLGEKYEADNSIFGGTDKPYWHSEEAVAVIRIPATVEQEKER